MTRLFKDEELKSKNNFELLVVFCIAMASFSSSGVRDCNRSSFGSGAGVGLRHLKKRIQAQ